MKKGPVVPTLLAFFSRLCALSTGRRYPPDTDKSTPMTQIGFVLLARCVGGVDLGTTII